MIRMFSSLLPVARPVISTGIMAGLCLGQSAWAGAGQAGSATIAYSQTNGGQAAPRAVKKAAGVPPPAPHARDWGVFNAGKGVAAGFGTVGAPGQPRWAEDWSGLASMPQEKSAMTGSIG